MQRIQLIIEMHGIIFSVLLVLILLVEGNRREIKGHLLTLAIFLNAIILAMDMLTIIYQGDPSEFGGYVVVVSNFLLYLFEYSQISVLCQYIKVTLESQGIQGPQRWVKVVHFLLEIALAGLILTPWTGLYYTISETHVYQRGPFFLFSMPLGAVSLLIAMWKLWKERNHVESSVFYVLSSIFVLPLLGTLVQMLFYGLSFMNMATTISAIILFFGYEYQWRKERIEQERRLALSRAYLLNSQIKPHFLFNSLSVIQSLIEEEPDTVSEAITHLSQFLRKGMNLKASETTVPLKEELEYVNDYMYLEHLRFGDKVNLLVDVPDRIYLMVPFLSLQPLVENAVRHGLRKKLEGGTVQIRVKEAAEYYSIYVIDDGAGFDVEEARKKAARGETSGNGVGMQNVETRFRLMCDGSMEIESTPGIGTTVSIKIPKKSKK